MQKTLLKKHLLNIENYVKKSDKFFSKNKSFLQNIFSDNFLYITHES